MYHVDKVSIILIVVYYKTLMVMHLKSWLLYYRLSL